MQDQFLPCWLAIPDPIAYWVEQLQPYYRIFQIPAPMECTKFNGVGAGI